MAIFRWFPFIWFRDLSAFHVSWPMFHEYPNASHELLQLFYHHLSSWNLNWGSPWKATIFDDVPIIFPWIFPSFHHFSWKFLMMFRSQKQHLPSRGSASPRRSMKGEAHQEPGLWRFGSHQISPENGDVIILSSKKKWKKWRSKHNVIILSSKKNVKNGGLNTMW